MLQLNFSKPLKIYEIEAQNKFEEEVLNFIKFYNSHDEIPVQTSGSTGKPKEIFLSKENMKLSSQLTGDFLNLKKNDTALLCLPVSYIAGKMMIVRAIELRLNLFCIEPKLSLEIPQNFDFAAMTPAQCEASFSQLNKIGQLIIGGAATKFSLRENLKKLPSQSFETYGMTETITHFAMRNIKEDEAFRVLPRMKIKVGERENLMVKTPYQEEWIETNDHVKLTPNGFIFLGRLDNVINSGGVKIHPEEVEDKLKPYIFGAFVVSSVPDAILGEKLVLVINQPQEVDWLSIQKAGLSKIQIPKEVIYLEDFPKTHSGKIQRKKIKEFLKA